MSKLQALGDYVIALAPEKITKTESGIHLTDKAINEANDNIQGITVVSIGNNVKDIKIGDKVFSRSVTALPTGDETYWLMHQSTIFCKESLTNKAV